MADFSIRNVDEEVREKLRLRAARHGRSVEGEIRAILSDAVRERDASEGLLTTLRHRFGALGGVDLDIPSRDGSARPIDIGS